jgi:hypothetical protein
MARSFVEPQDDTGSNLRMIRGNLRMNSGVEVRMTNESRFFAALRMTKESLGEKCCARRARRKAKRYILPIAQTPKH